MTSSAWNESTVTWNNAANPDLDDPFTDVVGGQLASVNSPVVGSSVYGTFAEWNVTSAVNNWLGGAENDGLLLKSFGGSNAGANGEGIVLNGAIDTLIAGNLIGTDKNGTADLGNMTTGISLSTDYFPTATYS